MSMKLGDNLTVQNGKPSMNLPNTPPPAHMGQMKRVRIILEDNPDIPPTGLFLGYNGNTYMIRQGVEVDIPAPLIEILNNAVVTVPIIHPDTLRVVGTRNKMRFPYRLVAPVPVAEAA